MRTGRPATRKPVASANSKEDDLVTTIDSYIENSTSNSRYRDANPNLQPIDGGAPPRLRSPIRLSSAGEKPVLRRHQPPISPQPNRYFNTGSDERLPSPSIDLSEGDSPEKDLPSEPFELEGDPELPQDPSPQHRRPSHQKSSQRIQHPQQQLRQQLELEQLKQQQYKQKLEEQEQQRRLQKQQQNLQSRQSLPAFQPPSLPQTSQQSPLFNLPPSPQLPSLPQDLPQDSLQSSEETSDSPSLPPLPNDRLESPQLPPLPTDQVIEKSPELPSLPNEQLHSESPQLPPLPRELLPIQVPANKELPETQKQPPQRDINGTQSSKPLPAQNGHSTHQKTKEKPPKQQPQVKAQFRATNLPPLPFQLPPTLSKPPSLATPPLPSLVTPPLQTRATFDSETPEPLVTPATAPAKLDVTPSSATRLKSKFKRLSLGKESFQFDKSDKAENGQLQKSPRFNWNNSKSKLSLLSPAASVSKASSNIYAVGSSPSSIKTSETSFTEESLKSMTIHPSETPFWKYHILKFGKDLYLTTNPGLKHIYCRNGPGYYVEVMSPHKTPDVEHGFTLIFKDIESCELENVESIPPIMTITKKSQTEGGYFTISLPRSSVLTKGFIKYLDSQSNTKSLIFNGLALHKNINHSYIPTEIDASVDLKLSNYEFKDFNNMKWNIGSIPRLKLRTLDRIKSKFVNVNGTISENPSDDPNDDSLKLVGKKNIYFHQNYVDIDDEVDHRGWQGSPVLPYKEKSNDPKKIYLETSNSAFPPVVAMFRPNESRAKRKIIKSFKQSKSKFQQHILQQKQLYEKNGVEYDKVIKGNSLEKDLGIGAEISSYFRGEDGLYYSRNPTDDLPDDNKLGWLTVYEDKMLFCNSGMFDIVLGLTLAIGYESTLQDR
ncbi:uncharacterized protein RJT20DRAFT_136798 [Scheffersomyces xylosifermentans]|uniref:uncharacterized protein n=1 Tax=Scheffersomyces xylosifermentans TaxID=1304137 RepID=UPI00315DF96C